MILKNDRDIETEGESNDKSMPSLEDASQVEYLVDKEHLVARRSLSVQIKEDEKVQYKNIFHTRCHVNNKVSSMINGEVV